MRRQALRAFRLSESGAIGACKSWVECYEASDECTGNNVTFGFTTQARLVLRPLFYHGQHRKHEYGLLNAVLD